VNKSKRNAGAVWVFAGIILTIYGITGLLNTSIPGVENLVNFINSAKGNYIYLAAFITIFIEGLYFIGSIFPGSTLVIIIAIISQSFGSLQFITVILTIYLGWILAGLLNMSLANKISNPKKLETDYNQIKKYHWLTWLPSFRSNSEVAEIIEGHSFKEVFWASFKVKTYAAITATILSLFISYIIDLQNMSNEESFIIIILIALVNYTVGIRKILNSKNGN
jgi:hypothetical protein